MAQITGYRKDRLGARIIALGNLLRLETRFGADIGYIWPDAFESHDMAIDDPEAPIFDADFQAKYIRQIDANTRPDFDGMTDLDGIRGRIGSDGFAKRLATGETFLCTEGLHPLLFSDEIGPEYTAAFRAATARMVFSARVQAVLDQAAAKLKAMGGAPLALHVRRGDVLDQPPWCHKNWVAKFAPDEFYEATMDLPDVSAVLFSDTPVVVGRMAAARPNAITLEDLVSATDLSEMQRDLVELLLMARCTQIVAPALSAFSASASMISGMGVSKLPGSLPPKVRDDAYDKLVARTLAGPESFHNTGDFAQSIGYAFGHALKCKQHGAFYKLMCDSLDAGHPFASYLPLTMALALANGETAHALSLHERAKLDPNIWLDDRLICDALSTIAMHQDGQTTAAASQFLDQFLARRKTVLNLDSVASYFFTMEPRVRDLFMVDDVTRDALQLKRIFLFPDDPTIFGGAMSQAYPFWLIGADWAEMFETPQVMKNAIKDPPFALKRAAFPVEIRHAEAAFFRDEGALPTDKEALPLLSALSVALSLSGRYRRASGVMFHCRKHDSDNPLYFKRLANRFVATGQWDKAERNLDQASKRAPDHPGLILARAQVAQAQDQHDVVDRLLSGIAEQDFVPFAVYKTWEKSLRKLKSRDAGRDVIAAAAKRFPGHPIFEKQWAGKL